ncbi:UNVERIFIED_CONTAM: hypothetical protein FKN15_012920 [Acipenser sinensis]
MFLMLLRLLVISVLTRTSSYGWTLRNHHRRKITGSDIDNRLRQVRSAGVTAMGLTDRSTDEDPELKLKQAIETVMNQTQKNNNEDSRHAFARIPLSGSRPQELNLDVGPGRGMRETMNHAAITNILAGARSTPTDSFNRQPHHPPFKQAKQFWNHFVLRRRSDSQEAIVPIKTTEVQQQTCKALPFLQV